MTSVAGFSATPAPPRRMGIRKQRGPKKLVGVVSPHYGLERVSYMLPVEGYEFGTVRRLPLHKLERRGTFLLNTPLVLDRSAHLLHTFNMLPLNGAFVVSFEFELPRYLNRPRPWQVRFGRKLLQGRRCRAILALTELAAHAIRRELLGAGFPDAARKVAVFRGGIAPRPVKEPSSRQGPLRLLFVGADGFRKGIAPTLAALEQLYRGGVELEFTVISAMTNGMTYTHRDQTPAAEPFKARLHALPWVKYHEALPNDQVRRLMREHDLLLLPSFDESVGWALIEAGMEGLASVLTNIMAFLELVEDRVTGCQIPIAVNEENRWAGIHLDGGRKAEAIDAANRAITVGLIDVLGRLAADRSLVNRWGEAAQAKMMRMYHPTVAARQLKTIYDAALSV